MGVLLAESLLKMGGGGIDKSWVCFCTVPTVTISYSRRYVKGYNYGNKTAQYLLNAFKEDAAFLRIFIKVTHCYQECIYSSPYNSTPPNISSHSLLWSFLMMHRSGKKYLNYIFFEVPKPYLFNVLFFLPSPLYSFLLWTAAIGYYGYWVEKMWYIWLLWVFSWSFQSVSPTEFCLTRGYIIKA